jgi:hypothetical protein
MSENPRHLPDHVVLPLEQMSGSQMSEPFGWLSGRIIESLVVENRYLVSVDHRFEERDGSRSVLCTDSEGATHMFKYDPTDHDAPVQHVLLGTEQID